jgi:hypothetical protein
MIDQTNGSQFDINSIMVYFYPSNLTLNNQGVAQNFKLSETDIKIIKKIYSPDQVSVTDSNPPHSHAIMPIIIATAVSLALITIAIVKHRRR